ncbi:hypothetical protein [Pantoea ananatis]|uniref:hypothetical protein n=1 Tax=Pantoea ananas TaxID=553 RepID=UPI000E27CB0F|nr:hypothetical protein [Pantoea ananatis]REF09762.1 hypothetical protein C7428_2056 [Pantoea ananatis]
MQINIGDFGYRGTNLNPVHTDNPEALAAPQAEKQAAQSTMQAQNTVQEGLREQSQAAASQAQAGMQLGNTIAGIGSNLVQYAQNLARQKAELQLQDYQTFKQGVLEGISSKVQSGELDSTGIQKAYQDGIKGWKGEQIPDLTNSDNMRLQKGIATVNRQGDHTVSTLYARQLQIEGVNALEQTAANYTQQMMQPGADVTAISGQIDELYNRSSTKALLGASWANQYQAAKKNLATTFYSSQIEANNTDNGALATLKEDINNSASKGILDLQTRTALFNTIDTKLARNDAKAIAAQNHADALATRREVAAVHADDQMQQRIARGEIPTESDWQIFSQKTDGTSVAGQAPALQATMKDVQQVLRMPTATAQQQLDAMKIELDRNGGTKDQYRYFDTLQRTVDQRRADVKNNPQAVAAVDSGQPLQPINFATAQDNPGAIGEVLQQRLQASQALVQKEGPTAGKSLLTPQEKSDLTAVYPKMSADQRVQFWRNMNASAGSEATTRLAKDIGGDAITLQVVSSQANTPNGYKVAEAIEKGTTLLNPPDGQAKMKTIKAEDVARSIKDAYPSLNQTQIQRLVPVMQAYHIGTGKRDDASSLDTDDMHAVIGSPVKVFGAQLVSPPGMDGEIFMRSMQTGINKLPGGDAANVRNHLNDGSYTFIPDASGNMRLINKDTQRAVTVSGKPFVVELSR